MPGEVVSVAGILCRQMQFSKISIDVAGICWYLVLAPSVLATLYTCECAHACTCTHTHTPMPTTLVMTTQHKRRNGHQCAQATPADKMAMRQDSGYFIPQDCSSKTHTHKTKSVNDNTWLPIPYHVPTANVCCCMVSSMVSMASTLCSMHVYRRLGEPA